MRFIRVLFYLTRFLIRKKIVQFQPYLRHKSL